MRTQLCLILVATGCASPPSWPDEAQLRISDDGQRARFEWPAPSGDVSAILVRVDGRDGARLPPEAREWAASDLAEGTQHRVDVIATDEADHRSALSATFTAPD